MYKNDENDYIGAYCRESDEVNLIIAISLFMGFSASMMVYLYVNRRNELQSKLRK